MYVPLFVQTSYSLLQSVVDIVALCKKCKQLGLPAVAITDVQNLFGAMEFSLECQKQGVKGIIGCRVRVEGNRELLLYCKNRIGYQNLSFMLSTSYTNSRVHEVRWEQLSKKSEGLIVVAVPSILCSRSQQDMNFCAEQLNSGIEWYVGLEPNKKCYQESAYLSQIYKTPVVAVAETCFLEPDQQNAHDVLLCIKNKSYISQEDRKKSDPELCLKTYDQMLAAFPKFAIENTLKIAEKCDFMLTSTSPRLPKFKLSVSEMEELSRLSAIGLEELLEVNTYIQDKQFYRDRLQYELSVIASTGFAGYFLIVADFIKFARDEGIPVGPGRGSCVASVVAWSIGITQVDPIRFDLDFERFLNPKRISIPDMDIDFSPLGRQRVIDYVKRRYGKQSVSGIITFGSLSSRAVLKDVGRVMQIPYSKTDNLSKQIQVLFGRPFTLQETYERDKVFAEQIDSDESLQEVFKIAKQLEGLHRHASAHAAGVIIADVPIYTVAPLYSEPEFELPLVQFSMKYAELGGLVKFDFLGLTALDIIDGTIKLVASSRGDKVDALKIQIPFDASTRGDKVDVLKIPFDDSRTFEMLRNGHTQGVFQFETPGMTKVIRDMGADCIDDLIAIVALYRPGPMENIDLFIRSKKGEEKIEMIYPGLEPILKNTYGIMVYQEQVIRIARDIAGYTLAEGDLFRRAIGKKIQKEMEQQREIFVRKTLEVQGGDVSKAEALFKQIETFANYGFNKAHAVAYAIIGYWGAYLKAHYVMEFMCTSMDQEQLHTEKLSDLVLETINLGLAIKKPDVNESFDHFRIVDNNIIYSLSAIKNLGEQKAAVIVEEREKNGLFKSVEDFVKRIKLNKREVESLAKAGAMDSFHKNRLYVMNLGLRIMEDANGGQRPLLPYSMLVDEKETWSREEASQFQKELLGVYLDENPLKDYPIKHFHWKWLSQLDASKDVKGVRTLCILESFAKKIDRNKKPYLICEVFDISSKHRCMITSEESVKFAQTMKGKIMSCIVSSRNGRITLEKCAPPEAAMQVFSEIHIQIPADQELENAQKGFVESIQKHKVGKKQVSVYLHHQQEARMLGEAGDFLGFCRQIPKIARCSWYAK